MPNRSTREAERMMDLARKLQNKCQVRDERIDSLNLGGKSSANNNDDDFASQYQSELVGQQTSSGRISRGSGESTFSSNDSDQPNLSASCSSDNSSGRSSANRESASASPDSSVAMNNLPPNATPETREASELVELVRTKFFAHLKESNANLQDYDELDLEELRKKLPQVGESEQNLGFRLISRFLRFDLLLSSNNSTHKDKSLSEAVDGLNDLLKFRKHYQLSQVFPDQFSKEFFILSGMFRFGHDRQNLPLLYLRARIHRRWSVNLDETFRRYVAWQINEITKSYKDAKVDKSIDFQGNVKDVRLLVNYYPTYCRYTLCLDLPWLFRSVWKMVQSWLPEDARNSVHLITSKELIEFVDEDQIPNSIRFNDMDASEKPEQNKHKMPKNYDNLREVESLAKDLGMSASELKQFKTHVNKVRKEYEQLGAI